MKIPPYLSALCIIVGVIWLLLLPLNEYSRQTYISENALLPGQVHTYFGGSEHNVFRAFRHEVHALTDYDVYERSQKLEEILKSTGLKTARQKYTYKTPGKDAVGENVYGVLQGPRADATEAVVLVASWKTVNGEINTSGVALALTLARYFKSMRPQLLHHSVFLIELRRMVALVQGHNSTHYQRPHCRLSSLG